jgi:hypothetical protein
VSAYGTEYHPNRSSERLVDALVLVLAVLLMMMKVVVVFVGGDAWQAVEKAERKV